MERFQSMKNMSKDGIVNDYAEFGGKDAMSIEIAKILLEKYTKHEKTIEAIEIILQLHYVEGDMTPKEALDEICHLIHPESSPSCSESATEGEK